VPWECGALLGDVLVLCARAGADSATASAAPPEKILKVRFTVMTPGLFVGKK
jgi:hypothetical protein